jgi:hypothetical protein
VDQQQPNEPLSSIPSDAVAHKLPQEDAPGYSPPDRCFQMHLALYGAFRDYVKHEDDLINHRLNWNFTIQGFLFAAYGFCMQKVADVRTALLPHSSEPNFPNAAAIGSIRELQALMIVICLVGFAVSVFVWIGVKAAQIALKEIEEKWCAEHPEYNRAATKTHGPDLPGIIGGGSRSAHNWGHLAPIALPASFGTAWGILLYLLL